MSTPKSTQLFPSQYMPIEVKLVTVTPDMAAEWLGVNKNNRSQRPRVIAAYARDLTAGDWLITGESIKFDWDGRLIDGQHRLEACVASGVPMETIVVSNLDPRVQKVLDVNARRTAADALKFTGVTFHAKDIAAVARVVVGWESGMLKTSMDSLAVVTMTNSEVVEWHAANRDVEQAVAFARRISPKLGAPVAGLGAAVLILMRIDADATISFLDSAAEYQTRGTGDPRKAMIDAFTRIRNDRRAPLPAETLQIVFRAWNAFRGSRDLKLIKHGASDGKGGITAVSIPRPTDSMAVAQ